MRCRLRLRLLSPLLLLLQWLEPVSSLVCSEAPTPALRRICEQLQHWDTGAKNAAAKQSTVLRPPGTSGGLFAAELSPIQSTVEQCMDIGCVCGFFRGGSSSSPSCQLPGGQTLARGIRQEYRTLSDAQRQRFHAAMRTLKNSGEYQRFARVHAQFATAGGAHSGPAFLGWHREYLKRMEFALRKVDPSVMIPYWDSTLDSRLPRPADSAMFSDELAGTPNGQVVGGPFRQWSNVNSQPLIRRAVGASGRPLTEDDISFTMAQTDYTQILAFTAPRQGCPVRTSFQVPEYTHGNVHIFVGGDMEDLHTAASDPVFWMHHAMIDLMWEQWRQARQDRTSRERAYPPDSQQCAAVQHFASGMMRPFSPFRNIDGLSNRYTDLLYGYAARPTCRGGSDAECGSRFLFCDRSHADSPHCAAKARLGGACNGFTRGEAVCYNGVCQGGRCVAGVAAPRPTVQPSIVAAKPAVQTAQTANCFNEHECCASWAGQGECQRNPGYMLEWCRASCSQCRPSYSAAECSNRHPNCASWAARGECTKNPLWMTENCRQACRKCSRTRAQTCAANAHQQSTVSTQQQTGVSATCDSVGCYNEDICCPAWSAVGQCQSRATYMACNCRVSCGYCTPVDYEYGGCYDYHRDCRAWSIEGQCQKNPWMLENCRRSCRSCVEPFELASRCGVNLPWFDRRRRRHANETVGANEEQ